MMKTLFQSVVQTIEDNKIKPKQFLEIKMIH